jgi:hypothetical protein
MHADRPLSRPSMLGPADLPMAAQAQQRAMQRVSQQV